VRNAIHAVLDQLPAEHIELDRQRQELIFANAELRAHMLDEIARAFNPFAEAIAERTGRRSDELDARVFVGALMGVAVSLAMATLEAPLYDLLGLVDTGFEKLESGITLLVKDHSSAPGGRRRCLVRERCRLLVRRLRMAEREGLVAVRSATGSSASRIFSSSRSSASSRLRS
jgi:hypothetical protein